MILHIVLYQPKASTTPEDLSALLHAVEVASREMPSVRQVRVGKAVDFGFGYNNWPKDQDNGFVAVFEFDDRSGLEAYLAHETHKNLAALFRNTCDQTTILDVSAVDPKVDDIKLLFGQVT